jgi:hypothetical protein
MFPQQGKQIVSQMIEKTFIGITQMKWVKMMKL